MLRRPCSAAIGIALFVSSVPSLAQDTQQAPAAPPASVAPRAEDGREECRWSGKRVITLLWRDDINGAREQLRFYDRFLCPDARLRDAFRCVIRSGEFDPEKPESVASKVDQCWRDPAVQPVELPSSPPPAPAAQ